MKKLFNHTKRPYDRWREEELEEEVFDWDESATDEEAGYDTEDGSYYAEDEGYYTEDGRIIYYTEDGAAVYYDEEGREVYYTEDGQEATGVEGAWGAYDLAESYDEEASGAVEAEGYYAEGDGEYYTEDDEVYYTEGDEEYYAENGGEYYAEDGETYYGADGEEAYHVEDGEAVYYTEDGEAVYYTENGEAVYYTEDGEMVYFTEDEEVYYAGDADDDDGYPEEAPVYYGAATPRKRPPQASRRKPAKKNFFAAFVTMFLNMSGMDRVVVTTGIAVLILALVTGGVFLSSRTAGDAQLSQFAEVGVQLDDIEVIGGEGLLAVADATQAKIAAAELLAQQEQAQQQEQKPEYQENEYKSGGTVALDMVSIQKDLKMKFTNQKTDKLISNVPFSVTVTDPDGKVSTWTDDDKDGIIYKKGITPGNYKVEVNAFAQGKYTEYTLPIGVKTIEVKKDIAYEKVDVKNEIKKESQINASKEDTKKNETVVESALEDTVQWVESSVVADTYVEVASNTIADPLTLAFSGNFMRTAYSGKVSESSKTLSPGQSFSLSALCSSDNGTTVELRDVKWSNSNPSAVTLEGNGTTITVKGVKAGESLVSFTGSVVQKTVSNGNATETVLGNVGGTCNVRVAEAAVGTVAVNPTTLNVSKGASANAQITTSGFTAGQTLVYGASSSNTGVATVSVSGTTLTVKGVAEGTANITVTAQYQGGTGKATTTLQVKVVSGPSVKLDKTAATVYLTVPVKLTATIGNSLTSGTLSATSSDTNIATVKVNGKEIEITGVKAGSCEITVKYTESGIETKATCAVTVKNHPKNDTTTKLKDKNGNQLYVLVDEKYKEAVYADYYTVDKFFIRGASKYTGWQTLDGKVYFFTAAGQKVTGEQVIQGAKYTFASDGSLVTGSGTMGIDVSKWNGNIDWDAVKNSGVSYVIIRCGYRGSSQGALIEDPKYAQNIQGATQAGLKVGVYFFTQAVDEVEAVEEASMVLEMVKGYKISYPIFLDVEPSGGRGDGIDKAARTAVCKAFCETIEDAGYTAGIYANKTWLSSKMNVSDLSSYKIWLAQYAATPTYTGRYDLWQYTSTGRVSGISGNVDLNVSYLGY